MVSFDNTEIAFQSKSDKDLKWAYVLFSIMNNQVIVSIGKVLLQIAMFLHLPVKFMIKGTIFKQFCGGESLEESDVTARNLEKFNVHSILDYSIEGKESESEFDKSFKMIKGTVENADGNEDIPFAVFKVTGMGRLDLLQKVNEGAQLSEEEIVEFDKVKNRIEGICKLGFEKNVPILIDAEESWIQDAIDNIVENMMIQFNQETAIVYSTAQMYRHDRLEYLRKNIKKAKVENYKFGIKLVRGAYMEKERERAQKMNYTSPINATKESTDEEFNSAVKLCVENLNVVSLCCGSHNEQSCYLLMELIETNKISISDPRIYFSQLLGMSDNISFNLSHAGYNVAKYVPFGPVYEVMPYLIRRTEENSSIAGQSNRELSMIKKEIKRRKKSAA